MHECLSPGMQDGKETNLGSQVLCVSSDRAQGVGSGREEQVVDDGFVLIRDGGDLFRESEDEVEIRDG